MVVVGHRGEWVTKTLVQHAPPSMEIEFVEQLTQDRHGRRRWPSADRPARRRRRGRRRRGPARATHRCCGPRRWPRWCGRTGAEDAGATLLTAVVENPTGYGRVVHGKDGAWPGWWRRPTPPRRRRRSTRSTPPSTASAAILAPTLRRLSPANAQGEYYLTDAVGVLSSAGYTVRSLVLPDSMEAAGVNDRAQLAVAEAELRDRINERWMRRGVTMWDPERTYVDAEASLDADVSLLPGVILRGAAGRGRRRDRAPRRARPTPWSAKAPWSAVGVHPGDHR